MCYQLLCIRESKEGRKTKDLDRRASSVTNCSLPTPPTGWRRRQSCDTPALTGGPDPCPPSAPAPEATRAREGLEAGILASEKTLPAP